MFWDHFFAATFLQVSGATVTSAASVRKFFSPFAAAKHCEAYSFAFPLQNVNIFHRAVQNRTRRHFQLNGTQVATVTLVYGYKARSKSGPKKNFGDPPWRRRPHVTLTVTLASVFSEQKRDCLQSTENTGQFKHDDAKDRKGKY